MAARRHPLLGKGQPQFQVRRRCGSQRYDLLNNTYKSNGDYNYNWVGNYFNDLLNLKHGITPSVAQPRGCDVNGSQNGSTVTGIYPCYASFTQGFGNPAYSLSTMDTGVFAQDNWKFNSRLTFELGLRWDHETIPPATDPNLTVATANPLSPSGSFTPYNGITNSPSDRMNFGPRIGFAYDVLRRRQDRAARRLGACISAGITNGNIENVRLATSGSPRRPNHPIMGRPIPRARQSTRTSYLLGIAGSLHCTTSSSCPTSYFMASNLKLPEVQEFDVQIQQALGQWHIPLRELSWQFGSRLAELPRCQLESDHHNQDNYSRWRS